MPNATVRLENPFDGSVGPNKHNPRDPRPWRTLNCWINPQKQLSTRPRFVRLQVSVTNPSGINLGAWVTPGTGSLFRGWHQATAPYGTNAGNSGVFVRAWAQYIQSTKWAGNAVEFKFSVSSSASPVTINFLSGMAAFGADSVVPTTPLADSFRSVTRGYFNWHEEIRTFTSSGIAVDAALITRSQTSTGVVNTEEIPALRAATIAGITLAGGRVYAYGLDRATGAIPTVARTSAAPNSNDWVSGGSQTIETVSAQEADDLRPVAIKTYKSNYILLVNSKTSSIWEASASGALLFKSMSNVGTVDSGLVTQVGEQIYILGMHGLANLTQEVFKDSTQATQVIPEQRDVIVQWFREVMDGYAINESLAPSASKQLFNSTYISEWNCIIYTSRTSGNALYVYLGDTDIPPMASVWTLPVIPEAYAGKQSGAFAGPGLFDLNPISYTNFMFVKNEPVYAPPSYYASFWTLDTSEFNVLLKEAYPTSDGRSATIIQEETGAQASLISGAFSLGSNQSVYSGVTVKGVTLGASVWQTSNITDSSGVATTVPAPQVNVSLWNFSVGKFLMGNDTATVPNINVDTTEVVVRAPYSLTGPDKDRDRLRVALPLRVPYLRCSGDQLVMRILAPVGPYSIAFPYVELNATYTKSQRIVDES